MAEIQSSETRTQRFPRRASATDHIRDRAFPLAVRGYDRGAVDEFVQEMVALVTDLESRQTREGVVQRALDEIGEETAGILQRAHETADEIAARSRAQAEGRIQRAEREADIVRRDADKYAEQVVVDTRRLWEERQRLIEDVRTLADEVLATADDAMERVKMPEPLLPERGAGSEPEGEPAEPPTAEVELDVLPGGEGGQQQEPS
jgi:DivIVA domain-containing protein